MPTQVPIEVFRIGHTVVDREEVERWMKFIGADEFEVPEDGAISNPALLIALAGKRCYMSFQPGLNPNVTKIRKEYVDYFDNILKSGHGSVLEHSVYTLAIENVSRVFTAEMNRHRAGWAISEGSLRFIRFDQNIPYWLPTSIQGPDVDMMGGMDHFVDKLFTEADKGNQPDLSGLFDQSVDEDEKLNLKKHISREVFTRAFANQESAYRVLQGTWAEELAPDSKFAGKKHVTSMMRRIVGLGVATGGVWSGNIRALRHVFTMRCSPQAEEEILHVFSRVVKIMVEKEPLLFGDFEQTEEGFWRPKYVKV